ncbi:MAG: DUF6491 family protein [Mizugakiibacter sp.]|uniref:DUF6491 family protein n=1 Tax=Mizugakiibacter sp. TaxID=1972610 RepID=UPI0031C0E7DE|nr:DUF6491 family protein [Xanthomonadaceae bacterium]
MPAIRRTLVTAACACALGLAAAASAQDPAATASTAAAPQPAGTGSATNAAPVAAADGPLRPVSMCLDPGRIRHWTAVDARDIAVQTGDGYYHVKLDVDCDGLRDGGMLMFRPTPSTDGRMCGDSGETVVPESGMLCRVASVRPLDKDGYKALLKGG